MIVSGGLVFVSFGTLCVACCVRLCIIVEAIDIRCIAKWNVEWLWCNWILVVYMVVAAGLASETSPSTEFRAHCKESPCGK